MEGKTSRPRALLVFGAPCSGKTTFAKKFADRFDLACYDFDEIREEYRMTRKNIFLFINLLARTKKNIPKKIAPRCETLSELLVMTRLLFGYRLTFLQSECA